MLKIGITGSLAMGKSTVARLFARHMPLFEADAAVAALYAPGGRAGAVLKEAFAEVVRGDGSVDKAALWACLGADEALWARLEGLVHPLVGRARGEFLDTHAAAPLVALEIPLLYESGADVDVDVVVVVSAPREVQQKRALARPGMTLERFEALIKRQLTDAQKRARADFVIDTSQNLEDTAREVDRIVRLLS